MKGTYKHYPLWQYLWILAFFVLLEILLIGAAIWFLHQEAISYKLGSVLWLLAAIYNISNIRHVVYVKRHMLGSVELQPDQIIINHPEQTIVVPMTNIRHVQRTDYSVIFKDEEKRFLAEIFEGLTTYNEVLERFHLTETK
jgi:membrane protein YdbS with pleckstrin-like domain